MSTASVPSSRAMSYRGMTGTIALGTDRLSRAVRRELELPDSCVSICLTTCEAILPTGRGSQTTSRHLSPLILIPVLARTAARRARYGVTSVTSR